MHKTIVTLPIIKLVGITSRTNNITEGNPSLAKITPIVQKYFCNSLYDKIVSRKKPGTTYSVFTDYETDHTSEYTYFLGEGVSSFDDVSLEFTTLSIPAQRYAKFTTEPGRMPDVCINAWQEIWKMSSLDFSGNRSYIADFEIYDERSHDPDNVVLDIYIGIQD